MAPIDVRAPISLGELYDKISILEIKTERISDAQKLVRIRAELSALREVAALYPADAQLYAQLKEVNLKLWDVEDAIREEERQKSFGDAFIELARSVYKLNDKRAATKKEINLRSGSAIVEVKSYTPYE